MLVSLQDHMLVFLEEIPERDKDTPLQINVHVTKGHEYNDQ